MNAENKRSDEHYTSPKARHLALADAEMELIADSLRSYSLHLSGQIQSMEHLIETSVDPVTRAAARSSKATLQIDKSLCDGMQRIFRRNITDAVVS